MPINTQNGSFEGDTPFFNKPWMWGQDDIQSYQDPNTGSSMIGQSKSPVVMTGEDGGGSGSGGGGFSDTPGPTGPTGPAGPTGPGVITDAVVDSTTTGPADATVSLVGTELHFDFVFPPGPTGPGVTGAVVDSTSTGPADVNVSLIGSELHFSFVVPAGATGGSGPTGPTGPKGSFVKTDSGVFELACAEGTRPYFFHIRRVEEEIPPAFLQTIVGELLRFPSHDGKHELCFAVRKEFPNWFMPQSNERQRLHSVQWWGNEYLPLDQRGPT